jgi:hypothetical protein
MFHTQLFVCYQHSLIVVIGKELDEGPFLVESIFLGCEADH